MSAVSADAPGKIILFGEHAVVYGRPAIAVPVLQVSAHVEVCSRPQAPVGEVRIQAPDVELDAWLTDLPGDHPLVRVVREVLHSLGLAKCPACEIRITSTIPVASGLGSGAAVSVAVIRALSAFLGSPLPDEQVSSIAFELEKLYHGTPSGIDNTVITYARPVFFVRGYPIETMKLPQPFTIVIGDTGVSSPTSLAVGDVRRQWQTDPARYEGVFDQIGSIAQLARQAVEAGQPERLGQLMNQNQVHLRYLGVSSPELESLIEAAKVAGALGAKLSGAGRGGNMIALVDSKKGDEVARALEEAGARRTIVTVVGG
jgi:mevalonate kinase